MSHLKLARLVGAVVVLVGTPWLAASAQTQAPSPPSSSASAPAARPEQAPMPQAAPPSTPGKAAAAPREANPLIRMAVFSSDGSRVGDVRAVNVGPDGNVAALHVRTGGFLGFGARIVAIPEGRFARSGQGVRLTFTAEEVGNLPQAKDGR